MEEILHQLRSVVYPITDRVLDIPGGRLGFFPSTVVLSFRPESLEMTKCSNYSLPWIELCLIFEEKTL